MNLESKKQKLKLKNKNKKEGNNMSNKLSFNEVKGNHLPLLEQYVPVVARVHGGSHPEFHDVHKAYDSLVEKVNQAGSAKPAADEDFSQLREITSNYTVPSDVCETYEAVYNMLSDLDKAYSAD